MAELDKTKEGLKQKYDIRKANGEPVSLRAIHFVLRVDPYGDHCHVEASRKALRKYAEEIEPHYPKLGEDLFELLGKLEEEE